MKSKSMRVPDGQGRAGVAQLVIQCEHPEAAIFMANRYAWADAKGVIKKWSDLGAVAALAAILHFNGPAVNTEHAKFGTTWVEHNNSYVNLGLNNSLDREWGLGGTALGYVWVSSNTSAVTASTIYANGSSAGTTANTIFIPISPAATRTGQTTTGGGTFTNSSFTGGLFVWNKIGLGIASTDTGSAIADVIGGSGGSSPYNRTFTFDPTAVGTFSVTAQIAVTAVAV